MGDAAVAAGVSPRRVSAAIFKLADDSRFDAVKEQIESDPRLQLEANETLFYADQSRRCPSSFLTGHHHLP
jgi:hypothetical protein